MMTPLADWNKILGQFSGSGYPVRCFVRYRISNEQNWHSFWERKRETFEREKERWRSTDIKTGHAEHFVIERLKKLIESKEIGTLDYQSQDYSYTCYPHIVYCYYGDEIETSK